MIEYNKNGEKIGISFNDIMITKGRDGKPICELELPKITCTNADYIKVIERQVNSFVQRLGHDLLGLD